MKLPIPLLLVGSTLALQAGIVPGNKSIGAVWFIGDSITQSNADGDANSSPRKELHDLLSSNGYTFTFTGHHTVNVDGLPVTGSTPETNLYHYHSGISGSVIGDNSGSRTGMTQNLANHWAGGRLASVKPDVILIMLGTNDINSDIDRANAPARLGAYLDAIHALPGVGQPTVLVANIPPNRTTAEKPAWVSAFNAEVPALVGARRASGKDVHFVDQFTPLNEAYATLMRSDNLHTNTAGNASLALQWFEKIDAIVANTDASGTGPLIATGDAAAAETDNSAEAGRGTVRTFASDLLADDLLNTGTASLAAYALDKTPLAAISPGAAALNDGEAYPASGAGTGCHMPATSATNDNLPFTWTATLDTSIHTAGYDLSLIRTFAGWAQDGSSLANQKYELLVSQVGEPEFTSLGVYTYAPYGNADANEAAATRLVLAHPSGRIASGVDQVRFVFHDPGFNNGNLAVDGSIYHELDLIGAPSPVPVDHGISSSGISTAAETNNTAGNGFATAATYSADIVADDLINQGRTTLLSASWDKTPFFSTDPVNDGDGHPLASAAGTYLPATLGTGAKLPFTYTAFLDTSSNPLGYEIQEIRSFAGWNQNGASLANQKYELLVRMVGEPSFESLGIHEYSPFANDSTREAAASKMTLTADDGVIATGVDAVRFVVMDHGFNSADAGSGGADGSVFQEFDVIGSAVPLPDFSDITLQGFHVAAETDNSPAAGHATAAAYSGEIAADDLINQGRPTLLSASWDKTPFFVTDPVNDGDGHPLGSGAGTYLPATFGTGTKLPLTYTANLNPANAPLGFRITGIRSFAGWNQNGAALANQKYQLLVRLVGSETFLPAGIFEYSPFSSASTEEAGASMVVLSAADGVIADGVDAVRFVALDHGQNNGGSADGTVYLEFDVLGKPTKNNFEKWAGDFGIPVDDLYDDLDRDGIPALLEYALGFSPLEIETLPNYQVTAGQLTLAWPKGAAAAIDPEIEYRVRVTDDLVDWELPDAGEVVENHHSISLDLATGASRRFARLEVSRSTN